MEKKYEQRINVTGNFKIHSRFGISNMPLPVTIVGTVILLVAYGLYMEVMRENAYLSRTVEIQNATVYMVEGIAYDE